MDQKILDALAFYADERSYCSGHNGPDVLYRDGGRRAREALQAIVLTDIQRSAIDRATAHGLSPQKSLALQIGLALEISDVLAPDKVSEDALPIIQGVLDRQEQEGKR
jgi:hypothetical protein